MSPFDYVKLALSRYTDFSGRSRRMEYWMFVVFNIVVSFVAQLIDGVLGLTGMVFNTYGPLTLLAMLALIVPGIACAIRRLHDQDKSGWWLLIALIPVIGGIVLLVFMFLEGTKGDNQYGPDPKGVSQI